VSRKGEFFVDLKMAGEDVEGVLDWSGNLVLYNKHGFKNAVRPDGIIEPPRRMRVAFLDKRGEVWAVVPIRASVTGSSTSLEVLP
jgi:hypothetical protein